MRTTSGLGAMLRTGTFLVTAALGGGAFAAAPPALPRASSAQLQKLLAVQNHRIIVSFNSHALPRIASNSFDRLLMWNEIALDTTAIDHTPVSPGETRVYGEQLGPARSSRAMAIIHIGMFEAVNAYYQKYQSYVGLAPVSGDVSVDYAIAQSAHDTLVSLYPSQQARLDALYDEDIATITGDQQALAAGKALGQVAAGAIIGLRENDGSQIPDPQVGGPFTPLGGVGHWSVDPVSMIPLYLGAYWGSVKPFVIQSSTQFEPPPPPSLTSDAYTTAFKQVEALGGDPTNATPTTRTNEQTFAGTFWSYDGTPNLCAPPRLYNQVARTVTMEHGVNNVEDGARMLALINTAMADAAITAWQAKWQYQFWRPVTGIRSADQAGNSKVIPDPKWYPLGAQATNSRGPNFTPPFPAYPSGHATIGGSLFQMIRHYVPDATPFVFTSDEWNGKNVDPRFDRLRPDRPQKFATISAAEYQNNESRIYLGVHWQFDADQGDAAGKQIADWVFSHAFQPVK